MKHLNWLRPSPAMVVACLALGIALGGTSYAAIKLPANSVGTKQLKRNAVTSVKIKTAAVTGPKVKNNSVTGADVLESSLAKVPSAVAADTATTATNATNAGNASTVAGATVRRFSVAVVNGGAQATVLDLNGLIITLRCPANATTLLANNNSGEAAQFRYEGQSGPTAFGNGYGNFQAGTNADLNASHDTGTGTAEYVRLNGTGVTAHYGFGNTDLGAAGVACRVFGYATSG